MKLFGITFGSNQPPAPRITATDREWAEEGFQWLLQVYFYPRTKQVQISQEYFPQTFATPEIRIENLIADCCDYLGLDRQLFTYELCEDLRDLGNVPFGFSSQPIDCLLHYDSTAGSFTLSLAKSLLKHPDRLIASACYELIKARLILEGVIDDTGTATIPFVYLTAVYFGYGALIVQNLTSSGRSSIGGWESQWSYVLDIPDPVVAYCLALFAKLKNEPQPEWRAMLPGEIKKEFDHCVAYLNQPHKQLFDIRQTDNELKAQKLSGEAYRQYGEGKISEAISSLQKLLFLTEDPELKAFAYNNIGYYKTRLGDYQGSISAFRSCLNLSSSYGYANDNLGLALIMTGDLEAGKRSLDDALETKSNVKAYTLRNLAIYYHKKQDFDLAEAHFQQAFDTKVPVDLLDFFYGCFLLERGDATRGVEHLKAAASLGEHEAVALLRQLGHEPGPA